MRMRIVLAMAATVATLVTAGPVTAAVAAPAAGIASAAVAAPVYVPHRCYVSDLAGQFHGAQAGLGNRGFRLTLTNVSGASCRLDGYPGLGPRGASDRALPTRERRGPTYFSPDPGPRLIVLSPGETASADVSFGVAGHHPADPRRAGAGLPGPGGRDRAGAAHAVLPVTVTQRAQGSG